MHMKKFIIWTIVILVVVFGAFTYWKFFYTYSEGYRAGLLQKFSYRGNVFKTYEGELILSSVESNKNVTLASEKFFFSVTDKRIAEQLIKVEGKIITVHYVEKNGRLLWNGDTRYYVDSVSVAQ